MTHEERKMLHSVDENKANLLHLCILSNSSALFNQATDFNIFSDVFIVAIIMVINPLKGSGVRWLHFEVLSAIQV